MNKYIFSAVLVAIFIFAMASCKTSKKATRKLKTIDTAMVVVSPIDATNVTNPVTIAQQKLIDQLIPLWKKQIDFKTFSGKAKSEYEGKGKKQEFTANIRIKKDEVIWVAVTALGGIVQVARIYITQDSFQMINYLEKKVTQMPLSEAQKILPMPVDFSTLQNLLIGNALKTSGDPTNATDTNGVLMLQIQEDKFIQKVSFNKTDNNINTIHLLTNIPNRSEGMIRYEGYEIKDNKKFAMKRNIDITNAGEKYLLEMNFNDVNFDKAIEVPFSIPKSYQK